MDIKKIKDRALIKSKTIGNNVLDSGRDRLKWVKENPEIVLKSVLSIATVVVGVVAVAYVTQANYERNNNLEDEDQSQSSSDLISNGMILEDETKTINYPDERKSPDVHPYHRDGRTYVRGGTDQDKEQYRNDHPLEFGLEL